MNKDGVARLAGELTNTLLNKVVDQQERLSWRDTVFAAAVAMKVVGVVAMELDAEPMTMDETLAELAKIFELAMNTTVMPVPMADAAALHATLSDPEPPTH